MVAVSPSRDTDLHRALAHPARTRILAVLRLAEEPLDVRAVADAVGLHPNTVRSHLATLEQAELVDHEAEERDRPGRPRLRYRAVPDPVEGDDRGYRFLAGILAGQLTRALDDPAAAAEAAGFAWGRYLTPGRPPGHRTTPDESVTALLDLLEEVGFDPLLERDGAGGRRVILRRCPFRQVAEQHPEVVCAVHLGLARGALAQAGTDVVVRDLVPFAEPGRCVSTLEVHQ